MSGQVFGSRFSTAIAFVFISQFTVDCHPNHRFVNKSSFTFNNLHLGSLSTTSRTTPVFCREFQKDWDGGVPLLLFATREVTQESLGFSPAELVFGHTVHGSLKLLKERWLSEKSPSSNLLDLSSFQSKLHRACEFAKLNLLKAQENIKGWYDKKAGSSVSSRRESTGFSATFGSTLQAHYSGPYIVERQVNECNYLIKTDKERKHRLYHINLLKQYFDIKRTSVWVCCCHLLG